MTDPILLDTHILIWLDSGDTKLRTSTRVLIDRHYQAGGTILVSAVTAWEVAMLADSSRISLDCPAREWMARCLDQPGFEMVPLSWRAGVGACELRDLQHRDPADRLLIATAIELSCALVTYDRRITSFADVHGRQYGLRLAI